MTIMGTIFACGIVRFSDGPISKRTDGGYKGKQGQPHTKEDFELFNLWQNTLMVLWPSGIMALYFLSRDILDKKKLNKF